MKIEKSKIRSIIMYIIGIIVCPLGVTLSAKSGFGVSMIEAPVYVSYLKLSTIFDWFSFGMAEYILQGLLILSLFIIVRKIRLKYFFSLVTAFIFGMILDFWRLIFGTEIYDSIYLRIIACAFGIIVVAFAVACFFRTSLPQEAWELFVKEVSDYFNFNMTKVKWIYDISSLSAGIVMMLIFFHRFNLSAIGIGTIITTIVNAPLIGLFGKIIDKVYKE